LDYGSILKQLFICLPLDKKKFHIIKLTIVFPGSITQ
jgi:hypothetical protein